MRAVMALASSATLLALPSELIEGVLVCSRSPHTVSSVAQTCRSLRVLVYASPDSHLWRELFLTAWDDPRPALRHYALVDPRIDPEAWDWGVEYRKRVSAEKSLKAWRRGISLAENITAEQPETDWYTTALSALSSVLSMLLTLQPFPISPPIALRVLTPAISPYPTGNIGSGVGDRRERLTSAPPLPPLLIMLASGFSPFQASHSAIRLERIIHGPHASHALLDDDKEVALVTIPTPSLPPQLVRTLLPSCAIGVHGSRPHIPFLSGSDDWGEDPLGEIFHRIICITGFTPVPPPLTPLSTSEPAFFEFQSSVNIQNHENDTEYVLETQENGGNTEDDDPRPMPDEPPCRKATEFPNPSLQHADARTLARRRVYDMRYLRGDRFWGPFRVVTRETLNIHSGDGRQHANERGKRRNKSNKSTSGHREARRLGTLAWAIGVDVDPNDFDSSSNESEGSDEDWIDPADADSGSSRAGRKRRRRQHMITNQDTGGSDLDSDTEPPEPEHPLISLILASTVAPEIVPATATGSVPATHLRGTRRPNARLPTPNDTVSPRQIKPRHLRPDYAYLASVRIVVEANLRELFGTAINDNVEATSLVRPGEVGMFWEDEEILQVSAGSFHPDPSSSSPKVPASNNSTDSVYAGTFELSDILSRFRNMEIARLGGACGYWSGWIEQQKSVMENIDESTNLAGSSSAYDIGMRKPRVVAQPDELEKSIKATSTTKGKGKGKEKVSKPGVPGDWEIGLEDEACEGWDWAGVAGIWRRCVCWMDYRELLFYNLDSTKFLTHDTQEACRIIPMEFRITGYSRAGLMQMPVSGSGPNCGVFPASYKTDTNKGYFRPPPVIHFSGSSIGTDNSLDDGRTVKGSVQLIGGGEVRWQMESTLPGTSTPEWSSEAIQVGGLGSAIGLLGMWTGARHERADPLGPFWAWKVA